MFGKAPTRIESPATLLTLLVAITAGSMEDVKKIITENKALLVQYYNNYDDGIRVFLSVTPYTLARWYLDAAIVEIILVHLAPHEVYKQLLAMPHAGLCFMQQGQFYNSPHFDPTPLYLAHDHYTAYCGNINWKIIADSKEQNACAEQHDALLLAIGTAQLSLPMYFLHEFVYTARPLVAGSDKMDYAKTILPTRCPIHLVGVELYHSDYCSGEVFKPFHRESKLGKRWIIFPGLHEQHAARIVEAVSLRDKEMGLASLTPLMRGGWFDALQVGMEKSKALLQTLQKMRHDDIQRMEAPIREREDSLHLRRLR